jgi:hypothetical protein
VKKASLKFAMADVGRYRLELDKEVKYGNHGFLY